MSSISAWSSRLTRRRAQWVVDEGLLRTLVPLNLLDAAELKGLVGRSQIVKLAAGAQVSSSSSDRRTVYLLSGIVEVLSGQQVNAVVAAGTDAARRPLLGAKSMGMSVRAKMDATLLKLSIDTDEMMFRGGYASDYEVSDIGSATGTDWLTRFLQAKVFTRLPPSNIQKLLAHMEEVEVSAGQVIMRQGESDNFYYIVKDGVCRVTMRSASGDGDIHLTELREGDGFGEEALITSGRRGATVTMVGDGRLMRLAGEQFTSLLVEPVLRYVTWEQARAMMNDGAVLLDVRQPEEFRAGAGAVNVPLGLLRSRVQDLDASRVHITVSNVLNRSSAAAFLLCQQGMDVYILQGGARAMVGAAAVPLHVVAKADPPSACEASPEAEDLTPVPESAVEAPAHVPSEPVPVSGPSPEAVDLSLVPAPTVEEPEPAVEASMEVGSEPVPVSGPSPEAVDLSLVPAPTAEEPESAVEASMEVGSEPVPASGPSPETRGLRLVQEPALEARVEVLSEPGPASEESSEGGRLSLVLESSADMSIELPTRPAELTLVPVGASDEKQVAEGGPGPVTPGPAPASPAEDPTIPLQRELLGIRERLSQEAQRRVRAEGLTKRREQQLQSLQDHLSQARARLKKVVSLARVTEARRRDLQACVEHLEAQNSALQQQVAERERRLAETELQRRELEHTLTALQARQDSKPVLRVIPGQAADGTDPQAPGQAAPRTGLIHLPDAARAARGLVPAARHKMLAPAPSAGLAPGAHGGADLPEATSVVDMGDAGPAAPSGGGRVRAAVRYGVWLLALTALLGATSVSLYELALQQQGAYQAHSERDRSSMTVSRPLLHIIPGARHAKGLPGGSRRRGVNDGPA